eukprot:CAMPEP_0183364334 /NCGR_PEP_ID=MMETSP0164_2-20130417/79562_1 /TAXON_ID=221442 /ORGANISM="Coccolithus pelagicus ssp braarudi, Strain PLY182g" /LENGTH=59 /DNA_ID=CAMNT_0025539605 /DNA_START=172 /DNA_END=351 /DNA_ORIENTATION=-
MSHRAPRPPDMSRSTPPPSPPSRPERPAITSPAYATTCSWNASAYRQQVYDYAFSCRRF